jgi:DNA/RNA-binding protein KIN17
MPKAEKGTPKDIANRIKAKGLQKLKFYCQLCQKQCRDENGFKCHMSSESHLRQIHVFSQNSNRMLDSFSSTFEGAFLETLKRRHGTKRVQANHVYQELIQDRHHVHMNSTCWTTLTDFVQYLGKAGKCVVDETERGWYIQYIDRDPALMQRQEAYQRRLDEEKINEERYAKQLEKQRVEAAKLMDRAGLHLNLMPSHIIDEDQNAEDSAKLQKNTDQQVKPKVVVQLQLKPTQTQETLALNPGKRKRPLIFADSDEEH